MPLVPSDVQYLLRKTETLTGIESENYGPSPTLRAAL